MADVKSGPFRGLPTWAVYAVPAGGVVLFYFYRRWSANKAASTAATVTPSTVSAGTVAASDQTSGIDTGALYGPPSTTTPQASAVWTAPTGEVKVGSGYQPQTNPGQTITGSTGTVFAPVPDPATAAQLKQGGFTIYYQPQPGIFSPLVAGLLSGTPQYYNPSQKG